MSFRVKIAALMSVCAIWSTSCVEEVTLDAMEEPTLVVQCVLTDEPLQTLHLVYTKGASRDRARDVPEAVAVLTDLTDGSEAGCFARAADGSWTLNYAAVPEHRYRLDVTVPGHEPIWAEQTMPESPGVSCRWKRWTPWVRHEVWSDDHKTFLGFSSKDDGTVGYLFRCDEIKDPVWFYGINYPTPDSPGEVTPTLSTRSPDVDTFNIMEEAFYDRGVSLWGTKESALLRATSYPTLDDAPQYAKALRLLPREDPSGKDFVVSGSFRGYISDVKDFVHAEIRVPELHWLSASEDYDRFLRDAYHLIQVKTSSNLADIFVRDNVYSNIQGGAIGIFGAKMERTVEWDRPGLRDPDGPFMFAGIARRIEFTVQDTPTTNTFDGVDRLANVSFLPFELLHLEVCSGHNDSPPEWVSYDEWYAAWEAAGYRIPVFVIQNEAELEARGLGQYGPVDFTRKSVLLTIYCGSTSNYPIGIGYARYAAEYGPYFVNAPCNPGQWCRFALLVDKQDSYASGLHGTQMFFNGSDDLVDVLRR